MGSICQLHAERDFRAMKPYFVSVSCFIHAIHNGPSTSWPNSTEAKFKIQGPGTSVQTGIRSALRTEAELLYSQSLLLLKEVLWYLSSSTTFLQDIHLLLLLFLAPPYDVISIVNGLPIRRGGRSSGGTMIHRSAVALLPKVILALIPRVLQHQVMPGASLHPSGPTVPCLVLSLCTAPLSLSCPPIRVEGWMQLWWFSSGSLVWAHCN